MKTNIVFGIICIALLGGVILMRGGVAPMPAAFSSGPDTLDGAIARAKDEGKVVFAVATADWCGPCQTYKRGALSDSRVETWLAENAVSVTIDITDRQNIPDDARTLGVNAVPATFVLNAEGELIAKAQSVVDAERLLELLEEATR